MSATEGSLDARERMLVEAVAERVVELLRADSPEPRNGSQLVSADALARWLGVSRSHVYEHADDLGAIRLGEGKRAHLRFDPETARAALARYGSEKSIPPNASAGAVSATPAPRKRRSLATGRPQPGSILPSRPRAGTARDADAQTSPRDGAPCR